jgi:hypothetical protein
VNPRVSRVVPNDDYTLTLTFADAQVRSFDVSPYLERGIFTELNDPRRFKKVRVSMGTVCWQGGQDFCPDTLYEESVSADS